MNSKNKVISKMNVIHKICAGALFATVGGFSWYWHNQDVDVKDELCPRSINADTAIYTRVLLVPVRGQIAIERTELHSGIKTYLDKQGKSFTSRQSQALTVPVNDSCGLKHVYLEYLNRWR